MKASQLLWPLLLLPLAGCTTVRIPPEQAAWAASVRQEIAHATETHYVYIPVADKQQMAIVEDLAFRQGRQTQRIRTNGHMTECVFVFSRFEIPWQSINP